MSKPVPAGTTPQAIKDAVKAAIKAAKNHLSHIDQDDDALCANALGMVAYEVMVGSRGEIAANAFGMALGRYITSLADCCELHQLEVLTVIANVAVICMERTNEYEQGDGIGPCAGSA